MGSGSGDAGAAAPAAPPPASPLCSVDRMLALPSDNVCHRFCYFCSTSVLYFLIKKGFQENTHTEEGGKGE